MTDRYVELNEWLRAQLDPAGYDIEPASIDASFRRYYRLRLHDGGSLIAMDAPPEQEDCHAFVTIARQLRALGLHTPRVEAEELTRGFLLLEDLGETHYLDALDDDSVGRLYGDALGALMIVQACGPRDGLPLYDEVLLRQEMALFPQWLLDRHLGVRLDAAEQAVLDEVFQLLVANALEQPRVCVLRDFHSRNLMVTSSPNPGVLDFQDAVIGPVTYDLVSLLKDCYIAWPREQVKGWVEGYFELALQSGVLQEEHEPRFLRWFDLMGVQRQLKAAGIFARLNERDGKPGYLKDIPRTLDYILQLEVEYPELTGLINLIRRYVSGVR